MDVQTEDEKGSLAVFLTAMTSRTLGEMLQIRLQMLLLA